MTGIWAAIWPTGQKKPPRDRHFFDEDEAAEFGHTVSNAQSLCRQKFSPFASWYHAGLAVKMTQQECPICRARLDELEGEI